MQKYNTGLKYNWHIREATAQDYEEVHDEPLEQSIRAWVLDVDGKLCGIGGVVLVRGVYTIFLKIADGAQLPKSIIVKALKEGWRRISQMKFVVLYAIKEEGSLTADNLFRKFGFKDKEDCEYGRVYTWQAR